MEYNFCAFALSILGNYTPEQAFDVLEHGAIKRKNNSEDVKKDIAEMVALKLRGLTYRAIGEIYGVSGDVVYTRIRRATGRLKDK